MALRVLRALGGIIGAGGTLLQWYWGPRVILGQVRRYDGPTVGGPRGETVDL